MCLWAHRCGSAEILGELLLLNANMCGEADLVPDPSAAILVVLL